MNADGNDKGIDDDSGGKVSALHDLIAGGVAGSASVIVGHPFDTVKVRLQTMASSSSTNVGGGSYATSGGITSLFKGMGAPLSTAAIVNAIIFASYGSSTRLWEDVFENSEHTDPIHGAFAEGALYIDQGDKGKHGKMSTLSKQQTGVRHRAEANDIHDNAVSDEPASETVTTKPREQNIFKIFTCGSIAGTVQAFVICPMEHIKCRLQVQESFAAASSPLPQQASATAASTATVSVTMNSSITQQVYKGPIDCGLSIIKNHGLFRGLYRGMGVTLWRETPAFGCYFATYDTFKDRVESLLEDKDESHPIPSHAHAWAASALAGGISGAWTWAIIYPFDVIKSKIQTSPLESHLQKGMWTVASDIVKEHGWRHMFRGLGVTLVRAFPVNAIIFPVYEFVLLQLGDG
ncbi:hypothetical protein ACHAXS_010021 [Conticribra weissflogii]